MIASKPLPGQAIEILYLSVTGNDDTVNWAFFCTGGNNSGKWSTIPVPSCWELQGFGTYNVGHDRKPGAEQGKYQYYSSIPASWDGKFVEIVFYAS